MPIARKCGERVAQRGLLGALPARPVVRPGARVVAVAIVAIPARRSLSAERRTVSAARRTVSAAGRPLSTARRTNSAARRSVSAVGRMVSAAGRLVSAARRTVSAVGRTVSAAGRPVSAAGRPVSAARRTVSAVGRTVSAVVVVRSSVVAVVPVPAWRRLSAAITVRPSVFGAMIVAASLVAFVDDAPHLVVVHAERPEQQLGCLSHDDKLKFAADLSPCDTARALTLLYLRALL